MIKTMLIDTPLGEMIAGATGVGICLLEFTDRKSLEAERNYIMKECDDQIEAGENEHLSKLAEQLKEYFSGDRQEFTLPLDIKGTEFRKLVWHELLKIPYGTTRTYMEQAAALNRPSSVRAVANANGENMIAIIIPCHRVIGSDGSLTGYGGGLEKKNWLLEHEKKFSGKSFEQSLF
ncbi:MAG TPA: methylated-DNA--[protein]-cysteine S-methyltransferase [Bacteroidales bacterium]|nr:methylated-DNA--[protein]-cysteine S-methyltransferase [Bacteroidales bacterium]